MHFPIYYLPPGVRTPSVLTVYDVRFAHFPETYPKARATFLRRVVPWSLQRAAAIITISEFSKSDLVATYGINPAKIWVTHLAARPGFSAPRNSQDLDRVRARYALPARFVLCVSTIEPRKNLTRLVRAFGLLVRMGFPHRLVLAGFAYLRAQELARTIRELGLQDEVQSVGYVPDEDLPALYNLADLFVYPSTFEGFGIPVLEAMASGVPVVASNTTAIPEVVGDAGVTVDPYDEGAMAKAMASVLENEPYAEQLKAAGLRRATQFTWERVARQTLSVYQRLA